MTLLTNRIVVRCDECGGEVSRDGAYSIKRFEVELFNEGWVFYMPNIFHTCPDCEAQREYEEIMKRG